MATADQIEKIVISLEEQGAGKAYVGVSRLNDAFNELQKKEGPIGVLEGFNALNASLSKSLVDLPNMTALTEQAARAWHQLANAVDRYGKAQADKSERNSALEAARKDAQDLAAAQRTANRVPTELQQAPPSIDWAAALAAQSQKAGSAIEAASHSAMAEATAIGEAAKNASKLASVYDVIENRAKEAARADQKRVDAMVKAANRVPTELQAASAPKALSLGQRAVQAFGRAFPRAMKGLPEATETLEHLGAVTSTIGPPAAKAALAVGAIGIAAVGAGALAAKSFATSVIEAQAYREDVSEAFKIVRRTQGDADAVMAMANQTSDRLGIGRAKGAGQFLELLSKGFDPAQTKSIVSSLADLSTVDPNASIDALTRVIGKIKAMGKISQDSVSELSTAGLEAGDVYAQLAKLTGKSEKEVQKLLSTGKLGADVGITAIEAAIKSQTGSASAGDAAAAKADRNLSSLLERVKAIPENILFDIKVGSGIDGVKDTLRTILDFFDTEKGRGKEVRQVVGDIFNALIEGLTGDKVDTKKGITGTLDAIVDGAKTAVPLVRDIAAGARTFAGIAASVGGAFGKISALAEPLGGLASVWQKMTFPLRILAATIVGPLALLPEIFGGLKSLSFANAFGLGDAASSAITSTIEKIKTAGMSIFNAALNIGTNLWQGMVQGIYSGIGAVTQAATNLASAALSAVGVKWDAHSPARAFEELSLFAAEGTARGFYKGTGMAVAGAQYMATAALGATGAGVANGNGGAAITSMASAGAAAGPVFHMHVHITVSGASSPLVAQQIGAAAAAGARPEFEAMLGAAARRLRYG